MQRNGGFQVVFERLRRVKILNKEGLNWGDISIPLYHDGDQDEKITNLKVVTYNLENGKIVSTKAKSETFMKEKFNANWIFTKIAWPNVKEGSILEISYTVASDFLFNFQDWEFQTSIPTRWSEYRAHVPEYYNYVKYAQGYVAFDVNESEKSPKYFTVDYKERTSANGIGTNTTYNEQRIDYTESYFRWAAKDIPAFKLEPFMASSRDYKSKINFELAFTNFPQEFSNPGIKQYMGTWEDINKTLWNRSKEEMTGNNSIKDQVDAIVAGLNSPEEKLKALYDYVRQNVLWDDSYTLFPENSAKKTLEGKKGTSAEVNFLLAAMLEKAEINVAPVFISTRDHGYVRETMPVSSQFNYVLCVSKIGDKSILIDATDKFLPIGVLPERCLNGNGFVVSKEGFQWVDLKPTSKSKTIYNTDLTLTESGNLKGSLKIDKTGYNAADARRSYYSNGEKEYLKNFTEGSSWTLSKSEFQNVKDFQLPFKENHDLTISEHITQAGNTIYLNPFILSKSDENPFKLEKRIYPVDFGHPFDQMYLAKITIPDGYTVDELPKSKALALPENVARYSYNVSQTGNVISITSSLTINRNQFYQTEYPNLREFYSQMIAKQAEQIVLKKKQ
jgi:hypothetical protein